MIHHQGDRVTVHAGDSLNVLPTFPDNSVDAVVTDPPYGLEFMGKDWDRFGGTPRGMTDAQRAKQRDSNAWYATNYGSYASGVPAKPRPGQMQAFQAWCQLWAAECLRILKPGGHLLAFGGTRTYHRLTCAVEDAGFEIRDSIAWLYGSGFPKSRNIGKDLDKMAAVDAAEVARWQGWGTAMKPAFEPIAVARKPLTGTVAANVLRFGTGALNIDGSRLQTDDALTGSGKPPLAHGGMNPRPFHVDHVDVPTARADGGRWPANVILDESQAAALDEMTGKLSSGSRRAGKHRLMGYQGADAAPMPEVTGDSGGASRFFYCAKAAKRERPTYTKPDGTVVAHPTVKPLSLMRWLTRLVTPPGGLILDPFAGSGATLEAAMLEGVDVVGIERDTDYLPLIQQRIDRQRQQLAKGVQLGLFEDEDGAA